MQDRGTQQTPLDPAIYAKSEKHLKKLKSALPPEAVEDLAGEVIRCLAGRHEAHPVDTPTNDQIEHLCFALLAPEHDACARFVDDARTAGASIETIYLEYLPGAARKLGDWWDDDLISFTEVTIGTSRMYAVMNALRHEMPRKISRTDKSAIFASVPGEDHTLGVRVAADMFRKEGWDIVLKTDENHDSLVSYIAEADVPIIGISAAGRHSLHALSRLVVALRIKKPNALLFVGGKVVDEAPGAVRTMGVDGMMTDIDRARSLLERYLQDGEV